MIGVEGATFTGARGPRSALPGAGGQRTPPGALSGETAR